MKRRLRRLARELAGYLFGLLCLIGFGCLTIAYFIDKWRRSPWTGGKSH